MYSNRNIIARTRKKVGDPTFFLLVIFALVTSILAVLFIIYRRNIFSTDDVNAIIDKEKKHQVSQMSQKRLIKRYAELMHQCVMDIQLTNEDVNEIDVNLTAFVESDELFQRYNWASDEEHLNHMCFFGGKLLKYTLLQDEKEKKRLWRIIEFVLETIVRKLPSQFPSQKVPWGTNWYPFCIAFPRFLTTAAYTYRHEYKHGNVLLDTFLKETIPLIITNPGTALGWSRNGPNAIMLTISYLGAILFQDNYKEAIKTHQFQAVLDYLEVKPTLTGEGIYPDHGFVFHSNWRPYGHMLECRQDVKLLNAFFNLPNYSKFMEVLSVICNPSTVVNATNPVLITRTPNTRAMRVETSSYGWSVLCSIGVVSIREQNYTLQFIGQKGPLAYYEADNANTRLGQFAAMARTYMYPDFDKKLRTEYITRYPGVISFDNRVIALEGGGSSNTRTYACTNAYSIQVMLTNQKAIGVYNRYSIDEFHLSVEEIMLITEVGYVVNYYIVPNEEDNQTSTINTDDEYDQRQIRVSVNFGELKSRRLENIPGPPAAGATDGLVSFKNDSSRIHSNPHSRYLEQVERLEDGAKFDSFQISLDSTNQASFSTFRGKVGLSVLHRNRRAIITNKYRLYYYKDNLYLVDKIGRRAAVGAYLMSTEAVLKLDGSKLKRELGLNITTDKTCSYGQNGSNYYLDLTEGKRNYAQFYEVALTTKTDEKIMADIEQEVNQEKT